MPLWLSFGLWAAVNTQTGPLTVEEAVNVALRNGFSVQLAETAVRRNQARVAETRGQLGPRVNLSASYTRFDQATTSQIPGGGSVVVSPIDSKQAGISATLPIDISGALSNQVRAAQANLRAARENLVASSNDIKLLVRRNFFLVLRAERLVVVQEQNLTNVKEQLQNVQSLEAAGAAARVDVLRAQTSVQQAEADLISARNSLALARAAFNATLARPIETPVELVDVTALPSAPTDEDRLRAAAQSNRPEARAILENRRALEAIRRVQQAGNSPSLGVSVNYNRNFNEGQRPYTASGTLSLSWPLFDSGITRARVEQARQDEEQARIQYEQLLEGISQDVRQALVNLTNARQRLEVAEQQVTFAEENLRLARIRFQAGEGILLQVTDAQTLLTQSRTSLVSARYDYLTAYSELQRALGTDDPASASATTPAGQTKEENK